MACPSCGAAQYEPRLVVSTFCKKCGVHLSISKKQVSASSVSRAGGVVDNSAWDSPNPALRQNTPTPPPPAVAPIKREIHPVIEPAAEDLRAPVTAEEAEEGGFGVFLKQQVAPAAKSEPDTSTAAPVSSPVPSTIEPESEPITVSMRRPQSNSPPPTPAPEPMSASTLQKMKDQGMYRNAYFKDAECFDCGHKFKVSRSSRSANCPNCGSYISLEDIEINMASTQSIKTRGDVLIRKRGHLSTDLIRCKDLRCQGIIEANIHVNGDAIFRTTGTIIGEVRCRRFVIEKGADVTFMNDIHTEEADIQSKITGTIYSSGPMVIRANGAVFGDITARSVSIEPGGELNGAMNIVRSQPAIRPL